jgi:hypothetical protein
MAGGLHPNPGTNNIIIYHYFHRLMSQFPLPPPLAAPLPSRAAASLAAPGGETYRTPLYREISVFKRFRTPALSPAVSRYDPYFVKGESRYVVLILEFFWEKEKKSVYWVKGDSSSYFSLGFYIVCREEGRRSLLFI